MSLPIRLRPEAEDDLLSARDWYDQQRRGLGAEFSETVEERFAEIAERPKLYATVLRDVRRAKLRRFPYVVYYRVLADHVEVIAVLHGRRDPDVWRIRS